MCIARNDGSDPDQPHLEINDTFTIRAAPASGTTVQLQHVGPRTSTSTPRPAT